MPEKHQSTPETSSSGLKTADVYKLICDLNENNPHFTPEVRRQLVIRLGGRIVRAPHAEEHASVHAEAGSARNHVASPGRVEHDVDDDLMALVDSLGDGGLDVAEVMAAEIGRVTDRPRTPSTRLISPDEVEELNRQYYVDDVEVTDAHERHRLRERLAATRTYQRVILGGMAATLTAGTGVVVHYINNDEKIDDCTNTTHQTAKPGMTIQDVAKYMASVRGYEVSAAGVKQANAEVLDMDTRQQLKLADKSVEDASEILEDSGNRYCFVVPAPIAYGQEEVDGSTSLAQIANTIGQSVDTLQSLNAGTVPKDNNQMIPAGTIVWLDKKLDIDLILRQYHGESLSNLTAGVDDPEKKAMLVQKLADANIATFMDQDALVLKEGETYLLPYARIVTTPAMEQLGVTSDDILNAYKEKMSYDTRNEPIPAATPQPSGTPEVHKQDVLAKNITDKQRASIEAMNLKPEQKAFIIQALDVIMQTRDKADEKHINVTVLLAQLIRESGYGGSEKSLLFHNYLGMKANDGWAGPTTGDKYPEGAYRVYRDLLECIAGDGGYYDNMSSPTKPWYNDARANFKDWRTYLHGLQNNDPHSYAEDPKYEEGNIERIVALRLDELINVDGLMTVEVTAAPTPTKTAEQQPQTGDVKLDPDKYKNNPSQSQLPSNKTAGNAAEHTGPWLTYNGQLKLSSEITYAQRLEMVEAALNGAHASLEGFQQFQAVDLRSEIAADSKLTYFHGTKEDPNIPDVQKQIKFFVWHFTATNTSATGYEGHKAAGAMQNGGRNVGIQYYQDNKGTVYRLTDHFTYHTLAQKQADGSTRKYNSTAFGVEIAACEQAAITSKQYENSIYLTAQFLIDNKFISKDKAVTQTVNQMVIGHHEANPNGHSDNPGIVMDVVRQKLIALLVADGYKA